MLSLRSNNFLANLIASTISVSLLLVEMNKESQSYMVYVLII